MREIRGWQIGEVVTANYMTLDTANVLEEIGSNGEANLPCIYNGLTLQSQSGSGNSIVTFNPGVCRCQNLPVSTYTYLPTNAYGTSYPCFIDISTLDTNTVITLTTSPSPGYIVATFSINPVTSGSVDYVITGSLLQIATGSYNPQIHVRLCSYTYTGSTFVLDFTPKTSRDTDLTGVGGVQWNYQNNSLELNIPASQSGSSIVAKQNFTAASNLIIQGTGVIQSGDALQFYNPANTHFTSLQGGISTSNTSFTLPIVDAVNPSQGLTSSSGQLSFTNFNGNVAANDSNAVFTNSSNRVQICNPTATRTYTMPSTSILAGDKWTFYNQATSAANYITIQSSGLNTIAILPALGEVTLIAVANSPTTSSGWIIFSRQSQWIPYTPVYSLAFGTVTNNLSCYKLSLDSLFIRGSVTTGTVTSGNGNFTLPLGFTINPSKLSLNNPTSTEGNILGTYGGSSTIVRENVGFIVSAPSTSVSNVYIADAFYIGTSPLITSSLNPDIESNKVFCFSIEVPISS